MQRAYRPPKIAACQCDWEKQKKAGTQNGTTEGAFHAAILHRRFALLVGDNDLLFLYHCCGIVKQYFAAEVTLLDHPIVTLPLFLA
jgi:hypothetical protein